MSVLKKASLCPKEEYAKAVERASIIFKFYVLIVTLAKAIKMKQIGDLMARIFNCHECKFEFKSWDSFQHHIKTTHANGPQSSIPPVSNMRITEDDERLLHYLLQSSEMRKEYGLKLTDGKLEIGSELVYQGLSLNEKSNLAKALRLHDKQLPKQDEVRLKEDFP